MNPLLLTDGYKTGHHLMYPEGTTLVYSNFTPRSNKYAPKGCDQLVSFGQQMMMLQIHEAFEHNFFNKPKDEVCNEMKEELEMYLGMLYDVTHFENLHDLGYLPIHVKIIEEGTLVPMRVPVLTIYNTHPDFYWITNYLETIISNLLWKPMTSATIAHTYRKLLTKWQEKTDKENGWFIDWQGHDFSMRGLDSIDAVVSSGLGHLTSFMGTDSLPTIHGARKYYAAEGPVGGSVPATEHSVMCAGSKESEVETFRRLLQTYPKGILSVVSDTWDLWKVCTEHIVTLKEEILARDGKLVIRPDCYSEDTLILTPDGWKEFNQLTPDSLVAQVNENGSYSFVKPLKIVNEEYNGTMFHFKDFHGKMDLLVTPNHRMVYKQFDKWKIDFAEDCKPNNYTKSFIRSAKAGNKYQILTNVERLNIAFQADGSKCTDTEKNIRFSFSKVRKIQRLKALLDEMKLSYKEYNLGDGKVEINVEYSLNYVSKNFDWVVTSDLCSNWCQEFIEELSHWDSCVRNENKIKFDTTNFSVSQVVELIALSAGYGCLTSKYEDDRKEIFSDVYTSHILLDNKLGGQSVTVEEIQYNGRIVCVTVPTGKIVVKRNRCTMVCGNSGDPIDIICGHELFGKDAEQPNAVATQKGVVELLWDVFGGTINEQGYKVLDSHIGAIYGDSITLDRADEICSKLEAKGFASTNIVLGIGSFTYQFNTRDTFGFAMKATYVELEEEFLPTPESVEWGVRTVGREIFKDPITDDGIKKSAKGLLRVNEDMSLTDQVSWDEESEGMLKTLYVDGMFESYTNFKTIKEKLNG
jgi:nicotinic acid phosphoribosyltransferase